MDKDKTQVLFVIFQGEVLALFPNERYSNNPLDTSIMSFAHMGQHGAAAKALVRRVPA